MANNNHFKVTALAAAIAAVGAVTPAHAYEYSNGDFRMQVDTTVSIGASWRADDRDYRSVGAANAGAAFLNGQNPGNLLHLHGTSSQDNANLAWKKGSTFSEVAKVTIDLEMNYKDYGAFIRGKAFYDHRIVNGDGVTDKPAFYRQDANGNPLEPAQSAGRSADILDAFVWGNWWVGDTPVNVRLGKQVISWGEGLFFPNGINTINPVDVNALLAPGSEVKDALIPLNALYGSVGVTESLTLEGFILFEWKETKLPECGTFFSTTDLAGANCYSGFMPSGLESSHPAAAAVTLPRGSDIEPDDQGQFGFAARYFVDSIETEFALYYINYHSRLPIVSGHMPIPEDLNPAFSGLTLSQVRDAITGGNPANQTNTAALFPYSDMAIEYTEDISLFGFSFNTTVDFGLPGGATAFSGEISMRKDQPFQLEDGDTLAGLLGLPSLSCKDSPVEYDCYAKYEPGDFASAAYLGDYYQAEIAFIHFFDQLLGASRWTAIFDLAGSYSDLPSKEEALLNSSYNATLYHPYVPNTDVSTGVNYEDWLQGSTSPATNYEDDYYPTSGAWGYKLRFTGEYDNVLAGVNLRPTISFSHDVYGTTPGPITNFLEDRKALGLSLEGVYQNKYSMKVAYTDFYGAEPYNQLADRDYYSISAQASF